MIHLYFTTCIISEVNNYNLTINTYHSLVVMLAILALRVSQISPEDKRSTKSFDEKIINFITIQEHLLDEIAVFFTYSFIDYLQNFTNADILDQGNLNLVSEKSGNFTFFNLWEPCSCNGLK